MSGYLLALALGPVQDFIAAARRTRDLWFGSHLLSEISKAAAKSLRDNGAALVFPAPFEPAELAPASELSVANKILAEVPTGLDPARLAGDARDAALARWLDFANEVRRLVGEEAIRADIWDDQVEDVIEFYAAWVPLEGQYQSSRTRVERVLAGRKALRDFRPARGRFNVYKSSLDGARESVLSETFKDNVGMRVRLNMKATEHLDVVGLVKRFARTRRLDTGGGNLGDVHFVSVTRVAADPWIRGLAKTEAGRKLLSRVADLCHEDFAVRISSPVYQAFPFESDILYPSRLAQMLGDSDLQRHHPELKAIAKLLKESKVGEPSPYFAVLLADGDRIGAAISAITSPDEHRRFSERLSAFARDARTIVEKHHGCLVYSGGDDVLALLPVDMCVRAARELRDRFAVALAGLGVQPATLSVGIAIGHCLEPMEDHLRAAREAEKHAKSATRADKLDERDGLAIHLWTRGGDATRIRDQWQKSPDERLLSWADLFAEDQLPNGAAYDLRKLAADYSGWPKESLPDQLLRKDAVRLLRKKRVRGEALPQERIDELLESLVDANDLVRVASELIIARHLAKASKTSNPTEAEARGVQET